MPVSDIGLFVLAHALSYLFRFEFRLNPQEIHQIKIVLLWLVPLKVFVFWRFELYRGMWRYTSVRDFWHLAEASAASMLLSLAIILVFYRFQGFSRAVFLMDGALTFLLTGALRMAIRSFFRLRNKLTEEDPLAYGKSRRVLIIGAGDAGEKILREISDNRQLRYKVVGFVDDDPQKQNRTLHGIPVLGFVKNLARILDTEEIEEVLIAIPSATGEQMKRIVSICKESGVSYKTLPGIGELIDGRVSIKALRDVSYQDLLGRPPVQLDISEIRNYIDGRTVLVTGCGGSIGSELCRQLIRFQPRSLILLDASEANLFQIHMDIQQEFYFQKCQAILSHVQNKPLMNEVFQKYRPQVVFHAAAYKHVPMLEKNPWEAVFNNIEGSKVIMEMAIEYGVERFVLVSTDKAVRPTNVMGASKRITELLLQSFQGNGLTRFMAVRFGNVMGSSGSVVPLFRRQIEQGGPVTVTHPEVIRYFMTIPEAAQLIVQAGAMGEGGEVFVLEMGTPVKIAEMARDLIRLSGKDPDRDIKIVFTGLREGEKLYEELITVGEGIMATGHEKIMVLRPKEAVNGFRTSLELKAWLDEKLDPLYEAAMRFDVQTIKKVFGEILPEYAPQEAETVLSVSNPHAHVIAGTTKDENNRAVGGIFI